MWEITWQKYAVWPVHKGLTIWIQVAKVKNTDYCRENATKGCHGQTAESQAGTTKGKFTNAKLLAPCLTETSIQKTKTAWKQSQQISSWAELWDS